MEGKEIVQLPLKDAVLVLMQQQHDTPSAPNTGTHTHSCHTEWLCSRAAAAHQQTSTSVCINAHVCQLAAMLMEPRRADPAAPRQENDCETFIHHSVGPSLRGEARGLVDHVTE